jgi:kynurenine 3-monooxygenase
MSPPLEPVSIAGAGPAGALLAIFLRRRGFPVTLYERRADPRTRPFESGRSINLAMTMRGIHALKVAGVYAQISASLIPMRGRMIHDLNGQTSLQPYGQRPEEIIHSISRNLLNEILIDTALRDGAVLRFEHEIQDIDTVGGLARIRHPASEQIQSVPVGRLIATDGAGSAVRTQLHLRGALQTHTDFLEHAYKELSIPAGDNDRHLMEREALHIWPRGDYMLIALPNPDGSFTATLFLQRQRFESLREADKIEQFLQESFADAAALMPARIHEFQHHPVGLLGTVYTQPWHVGDSVLLLGDAAHAIVPFHGQGMNCCFEDCVEFDALLDHHASWEELFKEFEHLRKPNTDAIAAMALENYLEMRERVADARYQLQKLLSLELEKRHPQRFIPRYSMVSFHPEIGYATAASRGRVQQEILDDLTLQATSLAQIDYAAAAARINASLSPL